MGACLIFWETPRSSHVRHEIRIERSRADTPWPAAAIVPKIPTRLLILTVSIRGSFSVGSLYSLLGLFDMRMYLSRETARVPQSVTRGCASMLFFWTSTEPQASAVYDHLSHYIQPTPELGPTFISHDAIAFVQGSPVLRMNLRKYLLVRHAANIETPSSTECMPSTCMPHIRVGATANRQ